MSHYPSPLWRAIMERVGRVALYGILVPVLGLLIIPLALMSFLG